MAGEWLKMRHDLSDDPAVIRLADIVQVEEDAVIGKLFRLWSWADRHTHDGHADGVGLRWVDRLARCEGFGAALVRVGWLVIEGDGLRFPRFDRHCSDTAKSRALDAKRKQAERACPGSVQVLSGSEPDRNRTREEEEKNKRIPPLPREGFDKQAWQAFRKAWNAGPGKKWKPVNPPHKALDRLADAEWVAMYPEAIERLKVCRFFEQPVSLAQFCGPDFVLNALGGMYDDAKRSCGDRPSDDKPPPKAWKDEYRPAPYRRPHEVAALADTLRLKEEDL